MGHGHRFQPNAKPVIAIASAGRLVVVDRVIGRAVVAARSRVARLVSKEVK